MGLRSLQDAICEAQMSFFATTLGENTGRLNKEMKNMKRQKKFGSANQTSKYNNKQIYYSAGELVIDAVLRKFNEIWRKLYFDELVANALSCLGVEPAQILYFVFKIVFFLKKK
jgi:hypothetical protein